MRSYEAREMAKDFNVAALIEISKACQARAQWLKDMANEKSFKDAMPLIHDANEYQTTASYLDDLIKMAQSVE